MPVNDRCLIDELSQDTFLSDQAPRDQHQNARHKSVLKFASASTATVFSLYTVSLSHTYNRLTQIASYIAFVSGVALGRQLKNDESLSESIDSMKKQMGESLILIGTIV